VSKALLSLKTQIFNRRHR